MNSHKLKIDMITIHDINIMSISLDVTLAYG